ncbi:MAG: hypothetical protein HQ589_08930 [Syntrophaceae bacterium]|nr:hypothetical protein [Syntrophaceae bacterium]
MKFDSEKFVTETCGSLNAAIDCIDNLIKVLNDYIADDEYADMNGYGCYGKGAKEQVLKKIKGVGIGEYVI